MNDLSTRPYLIRAIYEWCVDGGYTPYLAVRVNEKTEVPVSYVKDGEIVLNISSTAVRNLELGNEWVSFSGRFGGVSFDILVPVNAVIGIFAKETGQGLVFQPVDANPEPPEPAKKSVPAKPQLKLVK